MAWTKQQQLDESGALQREYWFNDETGKFSDTDPNPPAAPASGWVPYTAQWGAGEDATQDRGITDAASLAASQSGGSWVGPGYENMKNVGVVHSPSTGIDGAIFTDGQGNYFHNGQNLGWDDKRAELELGATATAMRQETEHNDSGLGGAINSFFDQYMPVLILAGAGAAVSFGSLAGAAGGSTEAAMANLAEVGGMGSGSEITGALIGSGELTRAAALETAGLGGATAAGAETVGGAGLLESAVQAPQFNAGQELATHPDELASVEGGSTQTGWTTPPAAPAPFTTGSKVVDWAAKQVISATAKGLVTTALGGGQKTPPTAPGAGGEPGGPAEPVSFGTFGLLDWTSAFKPVKKTKFQPDKTALENSGIAYSPR